MAREQKDMTGREQEPTVAEPQAPVCKVCGVKSFYVPRSNPDGYSVNVRCLDGYPDLPVTISQFDGRNWERDGASLRSLSKE